MAYSHKLAAICVLGAMITGCATTYSEQVLKQPEPKVVTAYGLGSIPKNSSLSSAQQELMAMRAAKLDAYRAIAEQVKGLRVIGNTTVNDLATTNDVIRSTVDASLKNVRILSVTPKGNGIYEALAEMTLEPEIIQRLWASIPVSTLNHCAIDACHSDLSVIPVPVATAVAVPVSGCSVCGPSYYYHAP